MFQFPGFAPLARCHAFSVTGCPIRTSADQFVFANPRSFSQLITSFFAFESLGIPHTLLLTSIRILTSRLVRLRFSSFSISAPCAPIDPKLTYVLASHRALTFADEYAMSRFSSSFTFTTLSPICQ